MCAGKCTSYNDMRPLGNRYWLANKAKIRGVYYNNKIHQSLRVYRFHFRHKPDMVIDLVIPIGKHIPIHVRPSYSIFYY